MEALLERKPVPDVEALRYHGTPEKPDIKIFVSHRIDLDSETIDNPLYIPVRCGAVYDERENVEMLGDDTGDNISEKRMSYCELTVQYWAWKNVKADYYGLCHYRRYIGFGEETYPVDCTESNNGCVVEPQCDDSVIEKHCLNENDMRKKIQEYDVIAIDPIKLNGISNYTAMSRSPDYHNMDDVDYTMDIIKRKYPKMIHAVDKYMCHVEKAWLYNCYIMRADIFDQYCTWLFDVLSEVEKHIDSKNYSQQMIRTPGTLAERLWGVYLTYLESKKSIKIGYQQLVFLQNTKPNISIEPAFKENCVAVASNFNNNYVPCFAVLLQSIIEHSDPTRNYDFIVLSQDITDDNILMLEKMIADLPNFAIRIVNSKPYLMNISTFVGNVVYTEDMYVRVLIPHILSGFDKVLVLDADMVCEKDISLLFDTDLNGNWAGAVRDTIYYGYLNGIVPGTLEYAKKTLKLKNPYDYCNTGVILFDCQKIRETYSLEYLQNYIHTHKYRIYEQDTLNVLLDGHIMHLDNMWNLYTYTSSVIEKCVNYAPLGQKQAYLRARKDPGIIHYAAHPKPWWVANGDFSSFFWKYARKTPYYEQLLYSLIQHRVDQIQVSAPAASTAVKPQSLARDFADVLFPKGSRRRNVLKKLIPKGSLRWRFFKKIYHIISPEFKN